MLAGVERHVHAAARAVDRASGSLAHRGERAALEHVVDEPVVVHLHVDDRVCGVGAAVGHLPALLGLERAPIEDAGGGAAPRRVRHDARVEGEEQRVLVVERARVGMREAA